MERGMHLGEYQVLAMLVPMTLWVAIEGALPAGWGMAGWVIALPVAWLALNLLPVLLGIKSERIRWWATLMGCVIWAVFHRRSDGMEGLFAYLWIVIGILSFCGWVVVGWRASMEWPGKFGIALRMSVGVGLHLAAIGLGWRYGWGWTLAAGAMIGAAWARVVFDPGSQGFGPIYRTVAGKGILITIDDGPDPKDTQVLLDLLDLHHAKAVFFMIGEKVKLHPETAREVIRRGHEIGNHTLTHPQASFWGAGPGRTRREIEDCQKVIQEVTGILPTIFRAPCGHRNLFTHPIAEELGLEVMAWNRRGYDAVETDATKVLARVLPRLSEGDIVLIHEATPIAAEVLSGLLEGMASRGLKSVSPAEQC